jgi:hypothetical protein
MNIRQYNNIIIHLIAMTLSASVVTATDTREHLKVRVTINRKDILPFEPIVALVEVRNISSEAVAITGEEILDVSVGRLRPDGTNWEWSARFPAHAPGISPAPPAPPHLIEYRANETKEYGCISIRGALKIFGEDRLRDLSHPGKLAIRCGVGQLQSEAIPIAISTPVGQDADAVIALQTSNLADFFDASTLYVKGSEAATAKLALEKFADKFSGSVFSDYARIGQGLIYFKGPEEQRNLRIAASKFESVVSRGSAKDIATYHLAECLVARKQLQNAKEQFGILAHRSANPVIQWQAKRKLTEIAETAH